MYRIKTICDIIGGSFIRQHTDDLIENLVFDSRRLQQPAASLFFALKATHNNGHRFLRDAYKKGIRNFIVSEEVDTASFTDSNFILVANSLEALQQLAAHHRSRFAIPVIGITGSNGKTIVKEWLFHLLEEDHHIVRSPKSYNSQIGVPLSIWQMNEQHTLGIFEAGISKPGEMSDLQKIIQPTMGILTNIGLAHSEGFVDEAQKLSEKLLLFKSCSIVFARNRDMGGKKELLPSGTKIFTWGSAGTNDLVVEEIKKLKDHTIIKLRYKTSVQQINFPFTDDASIENLITCCAVMFELGYSGELIQNRIAGIHSIDMRLQLNHSINDCLVINDSYSADITSLRIALDFLSQQGAGHSRTVILSDFFGSGKESNDLYTTISGFLVSHKINKVIAIGEKLSEGLTGKLPETTGLESWLSTDDFINEFRSSKFNKEIILIKGARKFEFERIARLFEKKLHQTVLEINLNALAHNLKEYSKLLQPKTAVMAMVKAFSYGSGGAEIASVLQYHHVNYLGVAYADEGVDLVKAGISIPIMVMNAEESSFQAIVDDHLQPVIYSFHLLESFGNYLKSQGLTDYPVHIEIETGMNRLGFSLNEVEALSKMIAASNLFSIQSVFSHLAASEDESQDDFTLQQASTFNEAVSIISKYISYPFLQHISNSAAIVRHPQLQMDMVRLGIGLYGIEIDSAHALQLQPVATLRSTIAQIKHLKKGESVSYNRRSIVQKDSAIATVRIGYADGYSRAFGNGVGRMLVNGKLAPVIGTVCMDMTMIDVTGIEGVSEGLDVIVFGPQLPVQEVAGWIRTIPYEVMTGISHRVKRVYFHE